MSSPPLLIPGHPVWTESPSKLLGETKKDGIRKSL